jgi:hypothetical protein
MFVLFHSQHVSARLGHYQVIREEYTNVFRHHLYIPHESTDDVISGQKYFYFIWSDSMLYILGGPKHKTVQFCLTL